MEKTTGRFILIGKGPEENSLFHLILPRNQVRAVLRTLQDQLINQHKLAIHPVPLKSIFKISATTEMDLEIKPMVQLLQADGEKKYWNGRSWKSTGSGELIYVRELGLLAELERPEGPERKFVAPVKMVLKKSQIPEFLQEYGRILEDNSHLIDPSVKNLKIYNQVERVEVAPEAIDRDWCWLSVRYGFGNSSVSLWEILEARKEGQRYISLKDGWVDCLSPDLEELFFWEQAHPEIRGEGSEGRIRLSLPELLRLQAMHPALTRVSGKETEAGRLQQVLELKPSRPLGELKGLRSTLRPYQKLGVEWLSFLGENHLGGLLCDDMGLGKTHQIMALMVRLREQEKVREPFLVVCPTTVLSHWSKKITEHTRGLKAVVFHGGGRNLKETLKRHPVLLTSYGILRNDIEQLKAVPFALAVFDEIQQVKNPSTLTHRAARRFRPPSKSD